MTPCGSGKYIGLGFGLRIETGPERTTIVDIFDIIQQVRNTGIHLMKEDEEQMAVPSLTTCHGYDTQMLFIRRLN